MQWYCTFCAYVTDPHVIDVMNPATTITPYIYTLGQKCRRLWKPGPKLPDGDGKMTTHVALLPACVFKSSQPWQSLHLVTPESLDPSFITEVYLDALHLGRRDPLSANPLL